MLRKKLGIIDADMLDKNIDFPNLVCMKTSAYYKEQGWSVELLEDYNNLSDYDLVSISKVFSSTRIPPCIFENGVHPNTKYIDLYLKDNIKIGGTGFYYDKSPPLPYDIEHHMPDYHLYDNYIEKQILGGKPRKKFANYLDFSIGFTTRGCFRKCSFCVNKNYKRVIKASPVSEFFEPSRPKIYLLDDNFMASPDFDTILEELIATKKPFQFKQGLDMRLMTTKKAKQLSSVNYYGDYIFAFDHLEDKDIMIKKLCIWRKYCNKSTKFYILVAYDSQDEIDIISAFERIRILMEFGCLPYIMRYADYANSKFESFYIQLARWCNQPNFFKKQSFRQFCIANEEYHRKHTKNFRKPSICYQTMLDFERDFPDIASRYFDLRFENLNKYNK